MKKVWKVSPWGKEHYSTYNLFTWWPLHIPFTHFYQPPSGIAHCIGLALFKGFFAYLSTNANIQIDILVTSKVVVLLEMKYCRSVFRLFVHSSHLGLELECDKKTDNIKWLMELFQWEYITATIHWPLKATFCTEKALSATFLRNWWDHFNIMCPIKWNLSICPTIKYLRLQNLLELTSQKSFAFMKFWMLIKAPLWLLCYHSME